MFRLYDNPVSGNCYKVRLLLAELDQPYERIEVELAGGAVRDTRLLALNPDGRVPVLVTSGGDAIRESNAILCYLAEGTALMPADRLDHARVLEWMFFEQNQIELSLGTLRRFISLEKRPGDIAGRIDELRARARRALTAMERRLEAASFLAGPRYTVADIALFAYAHALPEAGLALTDWPATGAWIARVQSRPRFVPMIR